MNSGLIRAAPILYCASFDLFVRFDRYRDRLRAHLPVSQLKSSMEIFIDPSSKRVADCDGSCAVVVADKHDGMRRMLPVDKRAVRSRPASEYIRAVSGCLVVHTIIGFPFGNHPVEFPRLGAGEILRGINSRVSGSGNDVREIFNRRVVYYRSITAVGFDRIAGISGVFFIGFASVYGFTLSSSLSAIVSLSTSKPR